jgi:hypothetical protein
VPGVSRVCSCAAAEGGSTGADQDKDQWSLGLSQDSLVEAWAWVRGGGLFHKRQRLLRQWPDSWLRAGEPGTRQQPLLLSLGEGDGLGFMGQQVSWD